MKTTTESLTAERGKNYGHPRDHFATTRGMFAAWERRRNQVCENPELMVREHEEALRHAVYMICDKLARAATNPMHVDDWDDIAGYARCAKMVLGIEQ